VEIIAGGLAQCGIKVEVTGLPSEELLAPGPDGPIFGRNFDLAQFAWSRGNYQLCSLFLTDEIPGPPPQQPRGWGGANAAGYSNSAYDQACWQSLTSLPDSEQAREGFQEAQVIFGEELPALPLYFRRDLVLTVSGFPALETGRFLPLWDLEAWE
jgi:peptide/nickel transport system substrate-binding protein